MANPNGRRVDISCGSTYLSFAPIPRRRREISVVEDDDFYVIFAKLGASPWKSNLTEVKKTSRTYGRCPYMLKKTSAGGDGRWSPRQAFRPFSWCLSNFLKKTILIT
ncbi:hypothetical protein GQ457_17G019840 [Hibiscus cannabinus]